MDFEYSVYYLQSKEYRPEITEWMLEYCIINSNKIRDRQWEDVYNAIYPIHPLGRILKVAYKIQGKTIKY